MKVKAKIAGFRIGCHSPKLKVPVSIICTSTIYHDAILRPDNFNPLEMPLSNLGKMESMILMFQDDL